MPPVTNLVNNFRRMSLKLLSRDAKCYPYMYNAWNSISDRAATQTPPEIDLQWQSQSDALARSWRRRMEWMEVTSRAHNIAIYNNFINDSLLCIYFRRGVCSLNYSALFSVDILFRVRDLRGFVWKLFCAWKISCMSRELCLWLITSYIISLHFFPATVHCLIIWPKLPAF